MTAAETHMPVVDTQLVQRVRDLIESAQEKGEPRPGRPAPMKTTGAKDHEVRKALFVLRLVDAPANDIRDMPAGHAWQSADTGIQTTRDGVVAAGDIVTGEAGTGGASPGATGDGLLTKGAPDCHSSDEITDAAGRPTSDVASSAPAVALMSAALMARLIVWGRFSPRAHRVGPR